VNDSFDLGVSIFKLECMNQKFGHFHIVTEHVYLDAVTDAQSYTRYLLTTVVIVKDKQHKDKDPSATNPPAHKWDTTRIR
jgi:hypothetical protein